MDGDEDDRHAFGAPRPWWHHLWCRFVLAFYHP